ncbi:Amino acid permease [Methanosarcina horonobensis HB-1 = JCM 15518]|uniref:Amino acid permease n=1 Tax=Methanosarcina horonobensis HB-1 = JCM 15518 TaxID=1434110 RepID=A0A0E3WTB7_9EURY|nr:amino acid permease [Methanosarcina horonobensis]AKB78335.1 Amino acid permease [Methanosarcina horonobensis HB-1 = JCM 15518]
MQLKSLNPEKNVKRIFWLSFGLTIFIYLMLAVTSMGADAAGVPLSRASGLVELIKFTPPENLPIWLMAVVIVANVTCWNFASSRLIHASGKEKVLPAYLGKLSKREQPMASILSMYTAFLPFPFLPDFRIHLENSLFCCPYRNRVLWFCQKDCKAERQGGKSSLYRLFRPVTESLNLNP